MCGKKERGGFCVWVYQLLINKTLHSSVSEIFFTFLCEPTLYCTKMVKKKKNHETVKVYMHHLHYQGNVLSHDATFSNNVVVKVIKQLQLSDIFVP
jgi:hypothetical protein